MRRIAIILFLAGAGLGWGQTRATWRVQAQDALKSEMDREKAGDCPTANSTRESEECLQTEIGKTEANYKAFIAAIRTMLLEQPPNNPQVAEFDHLEAESKHYRDDAAKAAFHQFEGGSLAPVFSQEAQRRLLRLHMQEIAFIYGEELSNH